MHVFIYSFIQFLNELLQLLLFTIIYSFLCYFLFCYQFSTGVGPNMLLARLATKKAKPDGLFVLGLDRDRVNNSNSNGNSNNINIEDMISSNSSKSNNNNGKYCNSNGNSKDLFANIMFPNNSSESPSKSICQTQEIQGFLQSLPLSQIPGVGFRLEKKLAEKKLYNCSDLWSVRKDFLKARSLLDYMAMVLNLFFLYQISSRF